MRPESRIRRQQWERTLSEQALSAGQNLSNWAFRGPGPRTLTLRKGLWDEVFSTLCQLTQEQRDLFVRYHVRQQSLTEISHGTGRTPHALQQALYTMHRRLGQLLTQQGWSATDAKQLFNTVLPPSSSHV